MKYRVVEKGFPIEIALYQEDIILEMINTIEYLKNLLEKEVS